jgi:hypothetical protein
MVDGYGNMGTTTIVYSSRIWSGIAVRIECFKSPVANNRSQDGRVVDLEIVDSDKSGAPTGVTITVVKDSVLK